MAATPSSVTPIVDTRTNTQTPDARTATLELLGALPIVFQDLPGPRNLSSEELLERMPSWYARGANFNACLRDYFDDTKDSITPIGFAIGKVSPEVIEKMIDCKADVNKPIGVAKMTPLMFAASFTGNAGGWVDEAMKVLISRGAVIHLKNSHHQYQYTALDYAIYAGYINRVKILLDAGSAIDCNSFFQHPGEAFLKLFLSAYLIDNIPAKFLFPERLTELDRLELPDILQKTMAGIPETPVYSTSYPHMSRKIPEAILPANIMEIYNNMPRVLPQRWKKRAQSLKNTSALATSLSAAATTPSITASPAAPGEPPLVLASPVAALLPSAASASPAVLTPPAASAPLAVLAPAAAAPLAVLAPLAAPPTVLAPPEASAIAEPSLTVPVPTAATSASNSGDTPALALSSATTPESSAISVSMTAPAITSLEPAIASTIAATTTSTAAESMYYGGFGAASPYFHVDPQPLVVTTAFSSQSTPSLSQMATAAASSSAPATATVPAQQSKAKVKKPGFCVLL